jgi:hypothetical protein
MRTPDATVADSIRVAGCYWLPCRLRHTAAAAPPADRCCAEAGSCHRAGRSAQLTDAAASTAAAAGCTDALGCVEIAAGDPIKIGYALVDCRPQCCAG